MKIQKDEMLIQDMGLKLGEVFQIGVGKKAFKMRYAGIIKEKGKVYDRIVPTEA